MNFDIYLIRRNKENIRLINILTSHSKLVIILTNSDDDKVIEEIVSYGATDYIVTSNRNDKIDINVIKRIMKNSTFKVMVVDDSELVLKKLSYVLDSQNLKNIGFLDGEEAWSYLNNPDSDKIDLVIVDYKMPKMNGYELTLKIRSKFNIEHLPILILSAVDNPNTISKFLRAGANDYIPKPFVHEEFIARVSNTLSMLSLFNEVKNMANTDYLTGLNNRIYFYSTVPKILIRSKRNKEPLSIVMIDIDNFKLLNDKYGHSVGDKALKQVSIILKESVRESDECIRFGGEEFLIVLPNCPHYKAMEVMQKATKNISSSILTVDDKIALNITISSGVTSHIDELDKMIACADAYMYKAKEKGKNLVYSGE